MRYVVVVLVSILAVTWTPGLVSAQGLFGCSDVGSSGGLPILGKLFGKKKRAMSCYDDPARGPGLAFYGGYLDSNRGVSFDYRAEGPGVAGNVIGGSEFQYPLSGMLLAGSGAIPVTKRLDILVNGSWLIPSVGMETQQRLIFAGVSLDVNWETKNQWWNAGAGATFNVAGPFSVVGGFLVDSFTTHFSGPTDIGTVSILSSDEADLVVNTVIPYAGALLTQGDTTGSLTIGMIGFPLLFGDAKFTQSRNAGGFFRRGDLSGSIKSGYFFEIFGETSVNIRAMSFGMFAGFSVTHAKMDMDYDYGRFNRTTGATVVEETEIYSGSFYRSAWYAGGKFALDFTSPF